MVARTLITTADESTWPSDKKEPVLFLGEWCKRYSRKHIWENMNYKVLVYHWDNRDMLYNDYKCIDKIYEEYLLLLSKKLNSIHGVNYSNRYWRILIGVWLRSFIEALYDRYKSISALDQHSISKTHIINFTNEMMVPFDTRDFKNIYMNDEWNHYIYSYLLNIMTNIKLNPVRSSLIKTRKLKTSNYKYLLYLVYSKISTFSKYYFNASYMDKFKLAKLQLSLNELPALDFSTYIKFKVNYDINLRDCVRIVKDNESIFDHLLSTLLPLQIPKVFLEGYESLVKKSVNFYPNKPKAILTANSYSVNDGFKIWAAKMQESGVKYCIIQHGGHYFSGLFSSHEDHQLKTSDKFYSWGVSKNKVQPMSPVKLTKMINNNPSGDILFSLMSLPRYSYILMSMPISGQVLSYIKDQEKLLSLISDKALNLIKLRVYHLDYGWDIKSRIADAGFRSQIDSEDNLDKKILVRLSECRLLVATYNATTYLETFSANYPTLLFWDFKFWELNDQAKPYFKNLYEAGILHYSPESLVNKLEEVYKDPMSWWMQKEVQLAKDEFCSKFANIGHGDFVKQWQNELREL